MNEVKVFISYASDAKEECDLIKDIIRQETENHFLVDGYEFKPTCWRDVLPGLGYPQEGKIDPIIADSNCRLVIILLKNKLGTIRQDGKTGIEHEYTFAKSLSKEIMMYHCDFEIRPSEIEPAQLRNVNEFVLKAKNEGLIEDRIPSTGKLAYIFRHQFSRWAGKLINCERDLSQDPLKEEFRRYSRGF